jgi:NAD(P)-dependent dehydrogenase (short-subunit alcohol dehydrogenase family)
VKELAPMLQRSPHTLPFPPRVIYTSSATAKYDAVKAELVHDYQLVQHEATYKLSKYLGDLVMCQLDRELGGERSVRCLTADPGAVATSIFDRGFGPWLWFQRIMKFFYWLAFALVSDSDQTRPDRSQRQRLEMSYHFADEDRPD